MGAGGCGDTLFLIFELDSKMRTGLRINDGCAYWRVQDRRPPALTPATEKFSVRSAIPYTLYHIGVEGSSRDLLHTLSCYRQDTGRCLRPGGWDMQSGWEMPVRLPVILQG